MTPLQTATALALIRVFETGLEGAQYGAVDALPGDKGHLTYGVTGAALADGSLTRLVQAYIARPEARYVKAFQHVLNTLRDRNPALTGDRHFHNLLKAAADDPAMRALQEDMFAQAHWAPALALADKHGIESALGRLIVLDSLRQGGWETLRRRTNKAHEPLAECGEPVWLAAYLAQRRDWLSTNRKPALRAGLFRTDALSDLVRLGNWDLRLPLVIRGRILSAEAMQAPPPGVHDGPPVRSRTLSLSEPMVQGADVRLVQLALSGLTVGRYVTADGIFGPQTHDAVITLQDMLSYPATGMVDEVLFDALKL